MTGCQTGAMSKSTRATLALAKAGVSFTTHSYDYDADADSIGLAAAAALGEDPGCVLKTLMVLLDGKPACAIVPSNREVAMKKLASALGGKSAQMMKVPEAERISGYKVGGISPFGQTRAVPAVMEEAAASLPYAYINGGQRGLQVRLLPADAVRVLGAKVAAITA